MGLFNRKNKDEETRREPGNPTTMALFRVLAVGYLLWICKDLIKAYMDGGPDAPSLWGLLAACGFFAIGAVVIGILTIRQYKQMKVERDAYNEELAEQYRLEEEAAARAREAALGIEGEEAEEIEEAEEYEEAEESEEA